LGVPVDAVVSPANCFGFTNGGIDRIYSEHFGWHVQDRLRELLARDWDGELPIGLAVLLETGHPDTPHLISAPTMRAPVSVSQPLNAYLAFRAVLRVVAHKNREQPSAIRSVPCGLCAKQMYEAYVEVVGGQPFRPAGVNDALVQHYRLLREE